MSGSSAARRGRRCLAAAGAPEPELQRSDPAARLAQRALRRAGSPIDRALSGGAGRAQRRPGGGAGDRGSGSADRVGSLLQSRRSHHPARAAGRLHARRPVGHQRQRPRSLRGADRHRCDHPVRTGAPEALCGPHGAQSRHVGRHRLQPLHQRAQQPHLGVREQSVHAEHRRGRRARQGVRAARCASDRRSSPFGVAACSAPASRT